MSSNDADKTESSNSKKPFLVLTKKTVKRKRSEKSDQLAKHFGQELKTDEDDNELLPERTEPLVIPVSENTIFKRKGWDQIKQSTDDGNSNNIPDEKVKQEDTDNAIDGDDHETARAVQALQMEATSSTENKTGNSNDRVIEGSNTNTFNNETQQYQKDLEGLPAELEETSDAYRRVPIAEFGAALLRGMGWKDDTNDNKSKENDNNMTMPRPHRLGLGAIPKINNNDNSTNNATLRRPDQYQRDKKLQDQQLEYQKERERKIALDKQRKLQNGSLVYVVGNKRARILRLVGVPGLNMVQIQYERDSESSIIKRNDIEGLISREELEEQPFEDAIPTRTESRTKEYKKDKRQNDDRSRDENDYKRKKRDREERREYHTNENGHHRKHHEKDDKYYYESSSNKKRKSASSITWIIANIRLRVITKKLGKRYYKEKGVVVDVTSSGVTIQLSDGTLLDKVPERYLETALPKQGGAVVVLEDGPHKHTKGRLLERTSRDGIIQTIEDMEVLTLSLDDIAEWCGPLDE